MPTPEWSIYVEKRLQKSPLSDDANQIPAVEQLQLQIGDKKLWPPRDMSANLYRKSPTPKDRYEDQPGFEIHFPPLQKTPLEYEQVDYLFNAPNRPETKATQKRIAKLPIINESSEIRNKPAYTLREHDRLRQLPDRDLTNLGREYGKGNFVFSGPNGIGYSRYAVDPKPLFVGDDMQRSDIESSDALHVLNAPKYAKIQKPRNHFAGEVGWGVNQFSDLCTGHKTGFQIQNREFWKRCQDRWQYHLLNPYYARSTGDPVTILPESVSQPKIVFRPPSKKRAKGSKKKIAKKREQGLPVL